MYIVFSSFFLFIPCTKRIEIFYLTFLSPTMSHHLYFVTSIKNNHNHYSYFNWRSQLHFLSLNCYILKEWDRNLRQTIYIHLWPASIINKLMTLCWLQNATKQMKCSPLIAMHNPSLFILIYNASIQWGRHNPYPNSMWKLS